MDYEYKYGEEIYEVSICRDNVTGVALREVWRKAQWPSEGSTPSEVWHRVNGPAFIERSAAGVPFYELWCREGQRHRENGPAEIIRSTTTGVVIQESYFRNGVLSRDDGPAAIYREKDTGEITYRRWCRNGLRLTPAERREVQARMLLSAEVG